MRPSFPVPSTAALQRVSAGIATSEHVMDLRYTPAYDAFRAEVRDFVEAGWPLAGAEAALPLAEREALFRERAISRGYLYRTFPKKYGGSEQPSDILRSNIISEEFARIFG